MMCMHHAYRYATGTTATKPENPPSLVTALNSIPLVGEGLAYVKRTWHFCQTRVAGFEPAIWEPKSHALPFGDTPLLRLFF